MHFDIDYSGEESIRFQGNDYAIRVAFYTEDPTSGVRIYFKIILFDKYYYELKTDFLMKRIHISNASKMHQMHVLHSVRWKSDSFNNAILCRKHTFIFKVQ